MRWLLIGAVVERHRIGQSCFRRVAPFPLFYGLVASVWPAQRSAHSFAPSWIRPSLTCLQQPVRGGNPSASVRPRLAGQPRAASALPILRRCSTALHRLGWPASNRTGPPVRPRLAILGRVRLPPLSSSGLTSAASAAATRFWFRVSIAARASIRFWFACYRDRRPGLGVPWLPARGCLVGRVERPEMSQVLPENVAQIAPAMRQIAVRARLRWLGRWTAVSRFVLPRRSSICLSHRSIRLSRRPPIADRSAGSSGSLSEIGPGLGLSIVSSLVEAVAEF